MWEYRAIAERVIDGDTIDVFIDQGFHTFNRERLRLLGIDAPECRGEEKEKGLKVKLFVSNWLTSEDEWPLIIKTEKTDSFGRYLATVYKDGECLNFILLKEELAVPYEK